jgi:hypothetical protein
MDIGYKKKYSAGNRPEPPYYLHTGVHCTISKKFGKSVEAYNFYKFKQPSVTTQINLSQCFFLQMVSINSTKICWMSN